MSRRRPELPWADYVETLKPHERPMMAGSPASPDKSTTLRLAYLTIGILVTLTGNLGNAVVSANIQSLQGALGVTATEAAWLPVVYVMTNACMNLILIKFRMQYGLRLFTEIFLGALVVVSFAHLFINDFGSAIATRAVSGMAAAGLSSLGILYLIQAFPVQHRLKGLIIGIGGASFSLPLARLFSSSLLQVAEWRGLYIFELGLSLICLAAVFTLRLPRSERIKVFDKLDFVTFALFAPGMAMLTAALGLGRLVWWTEAPWVGWCLIGSIVLIAAALILEHNRKSPLINTEWLAGPDMIRLALAIFGVRVVLSEQTAGSVGFLAVLGLGPDQLHGLFWVILAATAAGTAVSALTLNMDKLGKPIAISLALIAIGAFIDTHATVLTRPVTLYFSQALLAFASALFIGPALMTGFASIMKRGPQQYVVSFIVLFSMTQNIGGLGGSALVGTVQTIREKFHSSQLTESMTLADPLVAQRIQQLGGAYARVVVDPAQRNAQGVQLLSQQITQQANVLAYNDVFLIIAVLAAIGSAWVAFTYVRQRLQARRAAETALPDISAAAGAE